METELVKTILQDINDEIRGEVRTKLKLVCKDVNQLRTSSKKVLEHISVLLNS